MPYLAVTGGLPGRVFVLDEGAYVAGRSPEAALELSHVEISRQHCCFTWDGERCAVEDLGSVGGTRVNGERIYSITKLKNGDRVGIGPVFIEFGMGEPPVVELTDSSLPGVTSTMLVRGIPAERIPLDTALVIGRDSAADVVLSNPAISRRHAQVGPKAGGGCEVCDLNSSSGSFVNGHRFDKHELTVGDRLQIGPFYFHFNGRALVRVANAAGGSLQTAHIFSRFGPLTILDDVTIEFPASRFIGIIGPSGAGKSSLLHAISGLRQPDEGGVFADHADIYAAGAAPSFGFVPQEDIVHPELTVMEALRFAARLRLPKETPGIELQKLLLQTMEQLSLRQRAGIPISRLSGGQRKRVSVGVELLARPAILFLDEPTSGLDPATEFQLMELLRDLADTGCTIVCTTHIMENAYLMDQVVVLVAGCVAFQGSPKEARDYFNVAKLSALYDKLLDRPAKEWQSEFREKSPIPELPPAGSGTQRLSGNEERRALALPILLQRQWAILSSDWRNFIILAGQPLIIAALVSWVTDERALVMFFAYLATLWFGCSNAAQEIVKEIAIYRRERLIGVGPHAYLTSKFLFLTAITGTQALLLYGALIVGEGGRDGSVAWQLAAVLGTALAAVGIGTAISAFSRTVMQAVMIVPLILIPQIVFSGYTVSASGMSDSVLRTSRLMPSFSAQVMMDTSFLWKRKLTGDTISDHGQSYRNLDPERELGSDDTYERPGPGLKAAMGHGLWAVGTYLASWVALRRRERT
ncbi:MAG: ABC-type multidrug transport system, ATPase component [Chthoniobacteraceae bacterium]|nr:ABC-type multidrug transport system, ATPase component [Chthoniobacteraceae bacterium]